MHSATGDTKREVAVIVSTRYTPKDRLEDMRTEIARYDKLTARVDDIYVRLGHLDSSMSTLQAILERVEKKIDSKDRP